MQGREEAYTWCRRWYSGGLTTKGEDATSGGLPGYFSSPGESPLTALDTLQRPGRGPEPGKGEVFMGRTLVGSKGASVSTRNML